MENIALLNANLFTADESFNDCPVPVILEITHIVGILSCNNNHVFKMCEYYCRVNVAIIHTLSLIHAFVTQQEPNVWGFLPHSRVSSLLFKNKFIHTWGSCPICTSQNILSLSVCALSTNQLWEGRVDTWDVIREDELSPHTFVSMLRPT